MYKQSISIFLSLFIISGVSRASVPFVDGILKYRIESSDGREQAVCCGFADNSHTLEPKPIVIPETPGRGLERFKAILPESLSPDIMIPDNR